MLPQRSKFRPTQDETKEQAKDKLFKLYLKFERVCLSRSRKLFRNGISVLEKLKDSLQKGFSKKKENETL